MSRELISDDSCNQEVFREDQKSSRSSSRHQILSKFLEENSVHREFALHRKYFKNELSRLRIRKSEVEYS